MSTVLGVFPYAEGVVAVVGTAAFYSVNGTDWLQINRDTYVAQSGTVSVTDGGSGFIVVTGTSTSFTTEFQVGDECRIGGYIRQIASITSDTAMTLETAIAGGVTAGTAIYKNGTTTLNGTILPRTDQGRAEFAWYPADGEYGSIVFSDSAGNNDLAYFKFEGTGVSRKYYYDVLTADGFAAPPKPKRITQFKNRIVVANDENSEGNVAWSENLSNRRFDGASAGTAQIDAPINAVKPLRDLLIIFTRNSISKLVDLDDPNGNATAILPLSYNVGTCCGFTVQEMGGDLIFLSPDGVRTLKAADQYGDVQFGNVARKIDPIIKNILSNLNSYDLSSVILRKKNQYRLFYCNSNQEESSQKGISATLKMDLNGNLIWQWAEISGMEVACIASNSHQFNPTAGSEIIYHGDYQGRVCIHDFGDTFGGSPILAKLKLNELDYGDIGTKKTLHYVTLFGEVEGATVDSLSFTVRYDFNSSQTAQPAAYQLENISGIAGYGAVSYASAEGEEPTYGGQAEFLRRVLVEGSGWSNTFEFQSYGTGSPYSLNSLYVDMRVGAKR